MGMDFNHFGLEDLKLVLENYMFWSEITGSGFGEPGGTPPPKGVPPPPSWGQCVLALIIFW